MARGARLSLVCDGCGTRFVRLASQQRPGRAFCSRKCSDGRSRGRGRGVGRVSAPGAPGWKVELFGSMSEGELAGYCTSMLSVYERGGRWGLHDVPAEMAPAVYAGAAQVLRGLG